MKHDLTQTNCNICGSTSNVKYRMNTYFSLCYCDKHTEEEVNKFEKYEYDIFQPSMYLLRGKDG